MDRYREAIGRLDAPTRKFLAEKGVFDLPDAYLADSLIQTFFDYADPQVPLIDKTDFLERYKTRNVPPLLLQSVMFVGSHFALDEHVAASPWSTRTEMTAAFFEKAKLIADFELERDQITLVQCFVLLAERWFGWTEERNTRYWMSRAINVAYMMGLHRKIETLNLTPAQKRLWNRVAWVTMAKDCFVAAMFGTPTIIDDRWTDGEELIWNSSYFDESRDDQGVDSAPSRTPETVNYSTALVWLGALGELSSVMGSIIAYP
ncbi:Cutinase transcription factor 1 beta [Lasiodiplodia theobromae]|uniref:Cutinase transcription factor 1 beta n=1 Tax=Lasiodiplodia theobromae TaxID=45133 RepID=A0A5N5DR77_9PEZI|nr:Cutinase transcription factor 1 beta [Lasiodiplodia theobromae]